ncbi:MAG: hypothetical protein IJD43_12045 [Thermoguttaceae bacterium]|nr:hypothetical protein [Thermoguttaceae bacterium]
MPFRSSAGLGRKMSRICTKYSKKNKNLGKTLEKMGKSAQMDEKTERILPGRLAKNPILC